MDNKGIFIYFYHMNGGVHKILQLASKYEALPLHIRWWQQATDWWFAIFRGQ